ncbi:hypothetical protein N781_01255 [Pontibacillus halophilus JSM 076056 = DSM 19796]|uniref:DUF1934 domain-containing protein n=1 Tax=Pontibacillus halophilus JSM 076056 = DSM 19796 TaxID=1385510 RepID=A0A0A5IE22_9BACI|nr:DUF1934 domain-containing protein [Pontibacillus halophilus]KGX94072.1 hypothetical protein N781_01255 [Pontibacillus halophilus JSM 076056 = DSM 19796]
MADERKPVQVRLETLIGEKDNQERIIVEEPGDYVKKGDAHILRFQETNEEGVVDTLVTIQQHKTIIRRTGPIQMTQTFREGKRTENIYHHPYGKFHLEADTNDLTHFTNEEETDGTLEIKYDLSVNGQEKQPHQLFLQYKEDKRS